MKPRAMGLQDQAARDAAVSERALNVLIDAGAGTGKTTTLVERLIALVAPKDDHGTPMRMDRMAAVTFTRRAAGELRLRLRERLLAELGSPTLTSKRAARLRNALGALDVAHVGTIHAFADRLLRLHPVEAQLSPTYAIVEDEDDLVRETFDRLINGAESGTLAAELAGSSVTERAAEAEHTTLEALRAGLRAESQEHEYGTYYGLDGIIKSFVRQRDVPPRDPPLRAFDVVAFGGAAAQLRTLLEPVTGTSTGARWLARLGALLERLEAEQDPVILYGELQPALGSLRAPTLSETFDGDAGAWHAWKLLSEGKSKKVILPAPLADDLLAPMRSWLATRLVRLFPVIIALYERVKARHEAVDSVDLLLKLRELLARDKAARGHYQSLFDHVFVDEFQDTDPLQAEVLLYLCERRPIASCMAEVELADGKLTLVGDPKQSIYRFRRADIAMYESVRAKVASRPHRAVQLTANFRSTPPLIEWFNDRFEAVMGSPPKQGQPAFNPTTGEVAYQPLARGRTDGQSVAIHVVPFQPEGTKVLDYRVLEAEVLAHYLRWLVERSDVEVLDPTTRKRRAVTLGDVAILALETSNLALLFPQLDAVAVPHTARGGTLFLQDPLHRQFLLALRAIANREDGVAQAALHRPPFFAIDVADLLRKTDAAEGARAMIKDLRARRLSRPPGATARDLLELTGFGRTVALGPNGLQRLERLRELCLVLEQTAAAEGLDYDGVTARMRDWALDPVALDAPHPVGDDAVQIMTVHQAKGLEFPVVVLWDGRAGMAGRADHGPWHVTRDGAAWQLAIDKLGWEEPAGAGLMDTEKRYRNAERKRLVYVAATRARDLLVVPKAGAPGNQHVAGMLLDGGHGPMALELQTYRPGKPPTWARGIKPPAPRSLTPDAKREARVAAAWQPALSAASAPRLRPVGVAAAAHQELEAERLGENGEVPPREWRPGRFGPVFGDTVHRALGEALRSPTLSAKAAVERATRITALDQHLDEAAADVERALAVLVREGLTPATADAVRIEYPIAGSAASGDMLVGYIDLLVVAANALCVIDFKTDHSATSGSVEEAFPAYVRQLHGYATLLEGAGVANGKPIRTALLFTDQGTLQWLSHASAGGAPCS